MLDFLTISTLHHAYLLIGRTVEVLPELRLKIGQRLGTSDPLSNPDYTERDFSIFGIKDSQELRESQARTAFGPGGRFFVLVIEVATIEAQNALLKTFEEPAPHTHFFILAHSEEIFLPTLRSRLEVLKLPNLLVLEESKIKNQAVEFLHLSSALRLEFFRKNFLKNKDIGKKELFCFLNELEEEIYKNYQEKENCEKSLSGLTEVGHAKKNLRNPRASIRLIFEHLSLVL